jgi:hypothetical protein
MNRTKKFQEEFAMKSTKKFILACLVLVMMAAVFGAGSAEAEIKVTFVNKTDRTVSVATCISGVDTMAKGWYNIQPGKSRTVTITHVGGDEAAAGYAEDSVGYYAVAKKKGAKTVYWRDENSNLHAAVHPTKSFASNYEDEDKSGMEYVGFRSLAGGWEINGNTATKTVTLTLN